MSPTTTPPPPPHNQNNQNNHKKPPNPIHSTFSATQIPTLPSNHTHTHPHPHSYLLQPPDSPKRSSSYTTTPTPTQALTPVANASVHTGKRREKHDDLTCDHKVKGALTELLNDGSVKADSEGRRSVQKFLLETERALREQRRESLGERKGRRDLGIMLGSWDGGGSSSASRSGVEEREGR